MAYSLINDISTTGSITATAQNVFLNISGHSAGSVQITGTWVGTLGFEGTTDGTTWLPINGVSAASSAPTPNAPSNALYRITPGGLTSFRIVSSAWTSGTAIITIKASSGVGGTFMNQIVPIRLTDGTNITSIKPASTATIATDIPLVVALHPSSPTPNFLLAQTVTGTRLNNGTSNASGSTHLTIGGSDGTNLKPLLVDVSGRPLVKITDGTNNVGITAAGIAGSEITVDRLKVNASLQLLDVAQAAGSQLVAAKGDQTTGLWVNIKNTSLPVTGTFFQATQPVSNAGTFAVQAAAILAAETTKVIGTVNIAAAQTLAAVTTVGAVTAITNALPAGANAIGKLTANTGVTIGAVEIAAAQTVAVTQATPANLNLTATPIAITKGTQGATGFTTQDLKDAGRNQVHYYMVIPVLTSATDTLQSLTGTKAGATVAATTTPAVVTTAKTLRITRVAATYIATAVSGYGIVRLRFNTAGIATITSPIAVTLVVGSGAPVTANATGSEEATLDEGWEFAAATGIGISVQGFAAVTATAVGYVLVSITGYEY